MKQKTNAPKVQKTTINTHVYKSQLHAHLQSLIKIQL